MDPQTSRLVLCAVACAVLCAAPAPALAGDLLSVDGPRVTRIDDPFVPDRIDSDLGREPSVPLTRSTPRAGAARSAGRGSARSRAAARRRKGPTRGQKAVSLALRRALAAGRITRADFNRYRRLVTRSRATRKKLRGARGRELGSVIATVEAIALRRQLVGSRMRPLFLILRRNLEYWPRRTFPANRGRVSFRGSELVFEYYRGSGLQLQPLVNFTKANLLHAACVKPTYETCSRDRLRRLLREMTATSSVRGGFRAWEYFFTFGGGRPPWISGMAQATGIQAFARAWQLLRDPSFLVTAREGFTAFQRPPATGVAARGPFGGTHYLQYSFAPRLFIINAFVQALIGLHDYATITGDTTARRLFAVAEPEARLEVPQNDTGDWSTYSFRGRESTAEYHELLRELLSSLCDRVRVPVYCTTARNFRRYTTEPAQLALLGPGTVVKDQATLVRFSVSKLSAVQLTITLNGSTALDKVITFRRGSGSFAWTPKAAGTYSVRLASKELRTGRGLRTLVSGAILSLPQ